ncbi:MAG: leucine-rich repeat protein [Prevotella sp.]|nr:leucine-rich repeat protein [Prevotella sp.]
MIQKVREYMFLIIAMMSATTLFANGNATNVLSDYDFFTAKIENGSSTIDAIFTVTNASNKEVMIGYDNFYYEADVVSPAVPNINDYVVEGTFVTAISKTTAGMITIPSTVKGTDGVTYKVTGIANHAFAECNLLTFVSIPSSITDIDTYAFNLCSGLESVKVDIASPLSIGESTFDGCYNAYLYVPKGKITAYSNAQYWEKFKHIAEYIPGDVNIDGVVNIQDVVAMISYILGTTPDPFAKLLGDLDNNDDINITDVTALINLILEK